MHFRDRIFVLRPHVVRQAPNDPQVLQPPSTGQGAVLHVPVSAASPLQAMPPWRGSSHVRERLREPPPHDLLHALHVPQGCHAPCSGQGCLVQEPSSIAPPAPRRRPRPSEEASELLKCSQRFHAPSAPQTCPPHEGAGLLHARSRRVTPVPHEMEHALQAPQSLQPPLTYLGRHSQWVVSPVTAPTPHTDPPVAPPHELSRLSWVTRTV